MKKSYHSMVVPMVEAMTARRSWLRCSASDSDSQAEAVLLDIIVSPITARLRVCPLVRGLGRKHRSEYCAVTRAVIQGRDPASTSAGQLQPSAMSRGMKQHGR